MAKKPARVCPQCKKLVLGDSCFCGYRFAKEKQDGKKQVENGEKSIEGGQKPLEDNQKPVENDQKQVEKPDGPPPPRRGYKICPQCYTYCHVRCPQCSCGFDFSSLPKKPKKKKVSPAAAKPKKQFMRVQGYVVHTPAGRCPLKYEPGENVVSWSRRLQEKYLDQTGNELSIAAVKYYLRQFVDVHSEKYQDLCFELDCYQEENDD